MGFAVSEMTFTPQLPAPMTYDRWIEITHSHLEKLPLDNAANSVILSNGIRSLNLFSTTSIDAEQLHDANDTSFHIWQATLIQPLT